MIHNFQRRKFGTNLSLPSSLQYTNSPSHYVAWKKKTSSSKQEKLQQSNQSTKCIANKRQQANKCTKYLHYSQKRKWKHHHPRHQDLSHKEHASRVTEPSTATRETVISITKLTTGIVSHDHEETINQMGESIIISHHRSVYITVQVLSTKS